MSGAGLRAGWGAGPEGEEGRARDAAGPSAEGMEELGCGSVWPRGEEGVTRLGHWVGLEWATGLGLGFLVSFPFPISFAFLFLIQTKLNLFEFEFKPHSNK